MSVRGGGVVKAALNALFLLAERSAGLSILGLQPHLSQKKINQFGCDSSRDLYGFIHDSTPWWLWEAITWLPSSEFPRCGMNKSIYFFIKGFFHSKKDLDKMSQQIIIKRSSIGLTPPRAGQEREMKRS